MTDLSGEPVAWPADDRLELLLALYDRPADELVEDLLPAFVEARRERLSVLYGAYRDDPRAPSLLFAADALLIFERLERDPDRLRNRWVGRLPVSDLEELASAYGVGV